MTRRIQFNEIHIGAALVLLAALACKSKTSTPPENIGQTPTQVGFQNVTIDGANYTVIPKSVTGSVAVSNWTPNAGFATNWNNQATYWCGDPAWVNSTMGVQFHARVLVFNYIPGTGPAGRGDYLVAIPDVQLDATRGGLMAVHYEHYTGNDGLSYLAWVAFLSEAPIPCTPR